MIAAGSLGYAIAAKKNSRKVAKTGRQVTDKPTPISHLSANQEATHTFDPDGSGPLPEIPVVKDEDGNINNAETGERIGQLGEKAFEKRYPDYSLEGSEAVTLTSGVVAGTNIFGWSVAAGTSSNYPKGGSLDIDPIPDQFIAIYSSFGYERLVKKRILYVVVKTGTTAPATIEVDGVSHALRSEGVIEVNGVKIGTNKDGSTTWGGFDRDVYLCTTSDPLAFKEAGTTRQIRILDANGNVLLGSLASP